jgi:hypothetical protein
MNSFHGEELFRITAIAALSALVGSASIVAADALNSKISGGLGWSIAFSVVVFFFIFVGCTVIGFLLHFVMRLSNFSSRLVLLPIFLLLSCLFSAFLVSFTWGYFLTLNFSVAFTAWLLYSFGPLRLWRFKPT